MGLYARLALNPHSHNQGCSAAEPLGGKPPYFPPGSKIRASPNPFNLTNPSSDSALLGFNRKMRDCTPGA